MKRIAITTILFAGASLVAANAFAAPAAHHAGAFKGQELAGQAKLTIDQARAIAAKARPGKVIDQELEKEAGGSGLRYAFDVQSQGKTYEVGVDASTGAILENATESAAAEAKEAKSEKAEKGEKGEKSEHAGKSAAHR
jgi:hypothetical protein